MRVHRVVEGASARSVDNCIRAAVVQRAGTGSVRDLGTGLTNHELLQLYNALWETTHTPRYNLRFLTSAPRCTLQLDIGLVPFCSRIYSRVDALEALLVCSSRPVVRLLQHNLKHHFEEPP